MIWRWSNWELTTRPYRDVSTFLNYIRTMWSIRLNRVLSQPITFSSSLFILSSTYFHYKHRATALSVHTKSKDKWIEQTTDAWLQPNTFTNLCVWIYVHELLIKSASWVIDCRRIVGKNCLPSFLWYWLSIFNRGEDKQPSTYMRRFQSKINFGHVVAGTAKQTLQRNFQTRRACSQ